MSIATMDEIIIAGWYPDPADEQSLRWWDGSQWTANVRARQPVAPVTHAAFSPVPIRKDATLPPIDPYRPMDKRRDAQSFVSMAAARQELKIAPSITYTASAWWFATLPLWWGVIETCLFLGLDRFYTPFIQLFVRLIVVFIAIGLMVHDRKILRRDGHPTTASPWWFLLTPLAYLIARAVHVRRSTRRGWAPVVVWVLCALAPVALLFIVPMLIIFAAAIL